MFTAFNQSDRRSLVLNLLAAITAVLAVNGLIFTLGWDTSNTAPLQGPVVGSVWVALFVLMAIARWQLNFYPPQQAFLAQTGVTVLIISCLIYPFYALSTGNPISGLFGNVITIALTVFAMLQAWTISKAVVWLLLPVTLWVAFATVTLLQALGWL